MTVSEQRPAPKKEDVPTSEVSWRKRISQRYSKARKKIPGWVQYAVVVVAILTFAAISVTGGINGNQVEYVTDTMIFIMIFAIFSLSLNLEYGFTGLVNFGKAGFFLIGAYSVAIIMAYYRSYFAWTGNAVVGAFVFGVIVGIFVSVVAGAALSAIGARLREDYFGILLLVFAEILREGIQDTQVNSIFGGPDGINGLPPIVPTSIYTNLVANSVFMLVLATLVFVGVYFIAWRMVNSPFGRVMRAVRDDEVAAQALGKHTLWYKIQVMMVGSAITAIVGAVYTVWILGTNPAFFLPAITFQIFIISIMGGASSLKGPLLGATIYYVIQRLADILKGTTINFVLFGHAIHLGMSAAQAPDLQYIITGILLILFVILRPQGLVTEGAIKAGKV
jgi:ABC-type branched-subunit amino acid transport system permease subunit